jgi:hypothetical protein
MTAHMNISADAKGSRPVYEGMSWTSALNRPDKQWFASSKTTPISYIVEELEKGRWVARQGFQASSGKPNVEIGILPSLQVAMTACERHDFRFWASTVSRAGLDAVFMGSAGHVADFVSNLPEHERDDLLDMISGSFELPDGRGFAESASYFPAVKAGLKQERAGHFTATLTVEAADVPTWLTLAAPGTKLAMGAVEVSSESSDEWAERSAHALRRSFALIQDNSFHAWLGQKYDHWNLIKSAITQTSEEVEAAVAETLRRLIGCPSRRELATNRDAVTRLEKLDREFYFDLSRGAMIG